MLEGVIDVTLLNAGHVTLAVIGIAIVEQLYRNTRPEQRWSVKFLCVGLGGLFAFDFYLYSDALLFGRIDPNIWNARGAVNALIVPLIGISAARNPEWSINVFISRGIVFHTTALLAAGVYLLIMAGVGYFIRYFGGTWGGAIQVIFLFAAIFALLIMIFSGHFRARVKVFVNKHFFHYQYDYREEWLRLINTLSTSSGGDVLYERAVRVLAEMVESPGGALWMRRQSGVFTYVGRWGIPEVESHEYAVDCALVDYLERTEWVIDFDEYRDGPEIYGDLNVPETLLSLPGGWLLVPMMLNQQLTAFVVLVQPRAPFKLNWEVTDLLKMAGRQTASYLALNDAAEALAEARQFEAFNRFSAFVMHDLKNLIAQLSLVARNAARHRDNPEFMDSVIQTVGHAVEKMNRLLAQLKSTVPSADTRLVDLSKLVADVVRARAGQRPEPELGAIEPDLHVRAERDRLASVLGHLIQNAQDATPADGSVSVGLRRDQDNAIVDIIDSGTGMDKEFVRDRLFRPFDTTKGLTGMGIGAYESREMVRALGGRIQVESDKGKGTRFAVFLPLARSETQVAVENGPPEVTS